MRLVAYITGAVGLATVIIMTWQVLLQVRPETNTLIQQAQSMCPAKQGFADVQERLRRVELLTAADDERDARIEEDLKELRYTSERILFYLLTGEDTHDATTDRSEG